MSNDVIQRRQNEEKLLKIQYAARECFNSAENLNHYVWLLCLISAFSVFIPDSWPVILTCGIPFSADIVALCFILITNQKINTAAMLRKYFDAYVLDISLNQFSETELRKIKETAENIVLKNPKQATIQMRNSGRDTPPGVFNWYVFTNSYTGVYAQFECQRQNTWWNSKMFHQRLVATIFSFVLTGIAFIILMILNDMVTILFCSAGLIIKIVERLVANGKYIWISIQIEGAQKAVEADPRIKGIEKLQNLIDERRSVNVLELNWHHKKSANTLSKSYENSIS